MYVYAYFIEIWYYDGIEKGFNLRRVKSIEDWFEGFHWQSGSWKKILRWEL